MRILKITVLVLATFFACSFDKSELAGPPVGGVDAGEPAADVPAGSPGTGGLAESDAGETIQGAGGAGGTASIDAMVPDGFAPDGFVDVGGATSTGGNVGTGGAPGAGGSLAKLDAGATRDVGDARASDAPAGQPACGDGIVSTGEQCDDGNTLPFDGCSPLCRYELQCTADGCSSKCGDGIVLDDACDDGNNVDGDGCSSTCQVEAGWSCTQPPLGDKMMVPAVHRDFRYHTPQEFEAKVIGQKDASKGMVENLLNDQGKPVYTGLQGGAIKVESKATFAMWYTDVPGTNHATVSQLALWADGKGAYVNRWGANGEQWNATEKAYYCGKKGDEQLDADGNAIPCTSKRTTTTECTTMNAKGLEMLKCFLDPNYPDTYSAIYITKKLDGTPLWFPVDGDTTITPKSEFEGARIPPLYETGDYTNSKGTWPYDPIDPNKDAMSDKSNRVLHNFSFTTEVRYWFKYETGKTYKLEFIGDDDLWVFVNKRLAVDLGGIHMDAADSVDLVAKASSLGLKPGNTYEIAIFKAERAIDSSTLKVTLPGFNAAPSECTRL